MEIKKVINVTIELDELKAIIVEHLKSKNIKVNPKNIYFNIDADDDDGHWRLTYKLSNISCQGEEMK